MKSHLITSGYITSTRTARNASELLVGVRAEPHLYQNKP